MALKFKKFLQDSIILYFRGSKIVLLWRVSRNCGTVPQLRTRLGWASGSAESITAVNELSKAFRRPRRESVTPAARWRLDLPGGGCV